MNRQEPCSHPHCPYVLRHIPWLNRRPGKTLIQRCGGTVCGGWWRTTAAMPWERRRCYCAQRRCLNTMSTLFCIHRHGPSNSAEILHRLKLPPSLAVFQLVRDRVTDHCGHWRFTWRFMTVGEPPSNANNRQGKPWQCKSGFNPFTYVHVIDPLRTKQHFENISLKVVVPVGFKGQWHCK